ncbi:hypothetical protein DY000_02015504 [Brassica cretica]|uniref:Uncharacterized protein n=1 Tax=Brassica cretica TaxID=69181 RepID=A0ABQ7D0N5_BRACR|nr:hypothetical protein DY000_02015504 [Brassica cretica]
MTLSWAFLRPTLDYCDLLQVNLGSTTVSRVGLSAGKAMDSGTMSLSGVVACWIDDRFRSRAVRWQGDGLGDYVAVWSRCLVGFGRAIGIQEEVFYACDLQNFDGEELRSKPCAENLAVHSGMTSGLVELAVGIILELVPGPGISGSLSLFGVDSVIILALELLPRGGHTCRYEGFSFSRTSSAGCTSGRGLSSLLPS